MAVLHRFYCITFLYLEIGFVLANSADPDEMFCSISSWSSLFARVPVNGFLTIKGLRNEFIFYSARKATLKKMNINFEIYSQHSLLLEERYI